MRVNHTDRDGLGDVDDVIAGEVALMDDVGHKIAAIRKFNAVRKELDQVVEEIMTGYCRPDRREWLKRRRRELEVEFVKMNSLRGRR